MTSSKDMNGNWVFLGQVKNNANVAYSKVSVSVKLLSTTNEVVATKSAYLDFSTIPAGKSLPFRVWFDTGPSYDHVETNVTGSIDPSASQSTLTVVMTTASYLASGDYHIQATIQNTTDQPISRPSYVVTLFSSTGTIDDYLSGFVTIGTLQPGESRKVDVTFYDPPRGFGWFRTMAGD